MVLFCVSELQFILECNVILAEHGQNYNKFDFFYCVVDVEPVLLVVLMFNKGIVAWYQCTVFSLFSFSLLSLSFLQEGGLETAGRLTGPLLFSASLFALTDPC